MNHFLSLCDSYSVRYLIKYIEELVFANVARVYGYSCG